MQSIKEILMERDGMSEEEALDLIVDARVDLMQRLADGEDADYICEEWFGLEPDYTPELVDYEIA